MEPKVAKLLYEKCLKTQTFWTASVMFNSGIDVNDEFGEVDHAIEFLNGWAGSLKQYKKLLEKAGDSDNGLQF